MSGFRVVDNVLHQRLADALRQAAVDLPLADQRVDHAPQVVDHGVAVDAHLAGMRVDFQFANVAAVGVVGRIGIPRSTGFQADAQILWYACRTVERLCDIRKAHALVGAGDAEPAFVEFDIAGGRLHQMRRHQLCFFDHGERSLAQGRAAHQRRPRRKRSAAEGHLVGVALQVADGFEWHPEPVGDHLRVGGGVPLPVRVRARDDGDGAAGIAASEGASLRPAKFSRGRLIETRTGELTRTSFTTSLPLRSWKKAKRKLIDSASNSGGAPVA